MTLSIDESKASPMMLQWHACKKNAPDTLLFFRLGDFYEAFYEDALLIAKELELTLTKRQEIPMCGVPFHTAEAYIDKLVGKGYRVAIAEQMEDPKITKGIVKREIVRIVTPGTVINSALLSEKSNNFLVALTQLNETFGIAILDVTTADFRVMEVEEERVLLDQLCSLHPAEILIGEKTRKKLMGLLEELQAHFSFSLNTKEEWYFDPRTNTDKLLKHFQVHNLDGFGLKTMTAAINAAGALLTYVKEDLNLSVTHIKQICTESLSTYLALSHTTERHLELVESLHEGKKGYTLLHLLDHTHTPMGGRLLKAWIHHPLLSVTEIKKRQDIIQAFLQEHNLSLELTSHLEQIRDLERLIMRIESGYGSPRDLVGLRFSLEQIAPVATLLRSFSEKLVREEGEKIPDITSIASLIESAIVDTPPLRITDGGLFKSGYHPPLDELRSLQTDSHAWIANYQTHLREIAQIKTLKVGFTKVFGYYIEVSKGQAERTPEFFQRRQTLVNGERFTTPELKEFEQKIFSAEEKISILENELFLILRKEVCKYADAIRTIATTIARIDALMALASVARAYQYVRPVVDESDLLDIEEGRHPVIEASLGRESFISNDTRLDSQESRLILLTGPNMAGKSTYIRQVALIVILAQMGSFVPAKRAHIGIVDKVFTRIGASDDLSRGQSTFMVEMAETSSILHNATPRSLVILDEIGRGTSTYDGISIAWAVAEHLLLQKKAKTLFATHYWELTQLEGQLPGAINFNVAVHESEKGIVFLHKIVRGTADKSYGIHVARLAGLPNSVVKRAEELLVKLEKKNPKPMRDSSSASSQLEFYGL